MADSVNVFVVTQTQYGQTRFLGVFRKHRDAQRVAEENHDTHIVATTMRK